MSDLLTLGSSGVRAYQRALLTTSNNIANLATEGYSRQEVNLETSMPRQIGTNYIGTGVSSGVVQRQYNEFIESNLRRSQSDLAGQGPMVEYTNRVIDLMAGEKTGLNGPLGAFFNAARDLSMNPTSTPYRSAFLRATEGVATGFRQISTQIDAIQAETRQGLEVAAEEINTLSSQLAQVNKQLGRHGHLTGQAPELLDQRDRLLRQLAEKIDFRVSYKPNGETAIRLGSSLAGPLIVNGIEQRTLGLSIDETTGRATLLLDPYNGTPTPLSTPSGGQVGGLLSFREQVLLPSKEKLTFLAQTLMDEVNAIHQSGVDANGNAGGDLFTGTAGQSAAAGIILTINDPLKIAAAGPFRIYGHENNVGTALATVGFTEAAWTQPPLLNAILPFNNAHEDYSYNTSITGTSSVVTAIAQGTTNSAVYLYPDAGQELLLFTRDGRQLLGPAQGELPSDTKGFVTNAQYSEAYLGNSSYLDLDYFIGAQAKPVTSPVYHPNSGEAVGTTSLSSRLVSERITATSALVAGDFKLNDTDLDALDAGGDAKAVAAWINAKSSPTGITARAFNEVIIDTRSMDFSAGTNASFTLKNTPITGFSSLDTLVETINAETGDTGVAASISTSGQLVLSTDGRNFSIASNTFMSVSGTFGGQVEITRKETQVKLPDLTLTAGSTLTLASGKPGDISTISVAVPQKWIDEAPANADAKNVYLQNKLVGAINAQSYLSHVQAEINGTDLVLINAQGFEGQFISLSGTAVSDTRAGTYSNASETVRLTGDASTWGDDAPDIRLGFGTGTASELKTLGFRTGAYFNSVAPEDLLVVVTGSGSAKLTAEYTQNTVNPQEALRALPFTVAFSADNIYTITAKDKDGTETELAKREFDPTQSTIDYRGLTFRFNATPLSGDRFYFDNNADGLGDNANILRLAALETDNTILPGGYTLSEMYLEQTGQLSNVARQSTIAQEALKVVHEQANEAKDKLTGVSLDEEAADLVRFQQAYQANAKVIQIASDLFNTILQSNR